MVAYYNVLGLQNYRQPTYSTNISYAGRPTPQAYAPYPIYGIGTGRASATGNVGTTTSIEGAGGDEPGAGPDTTGGGINFESDSFLGTINDYAAEQVESFFGFPTEINQLTGTMRATGIPDVLAAMMPMHMSALMSVGAAVSQQNLERIFESQKAGKKGYAVATLDDRILGVSPNPISTALGMSPTAAGALSGTIPDAPPGISQSAYEAAIMNALQNVQSVPGRPAISGIGPPTPATIGDITAAVNQAVYGTVAGADFGLPGGYVTSSSPNPLGLGYANINTPVRTLDPITGLPSGYVTQGNNPPSGVLGFSGVSAVDVASQSGFSITGALSPEDIAAITTGSVQSNLGQPPGIGPASTGGGSSAKDSDSTPSSSPSGPTGSMGSTSMGSNSGMSGPGDMGREGPEDNDSGIGSDPEGPDWATGGRIGMQNGGTAITEGFVNKDPSTVPDDMSIADNRYTSVKAGSFVVNQPANEKNKKMLDKVVGEATKRTKMKKGGKTSMVDVALSDGERLIEPEVVATIEKKYGKNFLDKINDEGKPEVKRRQAKYGEKIGAAQGGGGFLADQGMELGDVGEDIDMEEYLPVSDELKAKLSKFASRKPQRGQIKQFIRSLSPEDKLTVLFLTETQSTTDPIESMEAIGEVVKNRIGSDYYDFKGIKTLDDALLKQTRKGAFHFSGLEPSTFYARAKEVKKGVADKGLARAYAAAQNVLDPETEGQYRLPANTVFYTRKDAPSQWMRESKDLEFSTELGGHEFYRTFAAPELP
jgi:hypothetical protein